MERKGQKQRLTVTSALLHTNDMIIVRKAKRLMFMSRGGSHRQWLDSNSHAR